MRVAFSLRWRQDMTWIRRSSTSTHHFHGGGFYCAGIGGLTQIASAPPLHQARCGTGTAPRATALLVTNANAQGAS